MLNNPYKIATVNEKSSNKSQRPNISWKPRLEGWKAPLEEIESLKYSHADCR